MSVRATAPTDKSQKQNKRMNRPSLKNFRHNKKKRFGHWIGCVFIIPYFILQVDPFPLLAKQREKRRCIPDEIEAAISFD